MKERSLVNLGVFEQNDLAVIDKAVNDMGQDVLCEALILAVNVRKSQRCATDLAVIYGILHEELCKELAGRIRRSLAVLSV